MDAGSRMIHLPSSAVRLIGSTQVITSVYSVIKELLENSLDAGATSIDIKLPPLCSVSEVSVTTKTTDDDVSLTYALSNEGNITSTTPSHLGQGTTVCAKGLFKNLPVRKQYHSAIKKKKDDLKNVENLLLAFGLILPKVRFSFRHNKELVWQKVALDSTAAVLQSILGKGVMGQMEWKRKELHDPEIKLELCVPKPGSDVSSLSRSTSDRSFLCVNNRPVMIKEIDKLIRQYYSNCHACDMSRRPVYYLGITLPSRDVDVNIDPNKTTVMATNMNIVKEQLEELLLYIYGPLDQAPSWRYQDASAETSKSKTHAGPSGDLTERLCKTNNSKNDESKCTKNESNRVSQESRHNSAGLCKTNNSKNDESECTKDESNRVSQESRHNSAGSKHASDESNCVSQESRHNSAGSKHASDESKSISDGSVCSIQGSERTSSGSKDTAESSNNTEQVSAEPLPGEPVVIYHELTNSNCRAEDDANMEAVSKQSECKDAGADLSKKKPSTTGVSADDQCHLQKSEEKDQGEVQLNFELNSSAFNELFGTFPSETSADSTGTKSSEERKTASSENAGERTSPEAASILTTSDKNKTVAEAGQPRDDPKEPEVKVVGEGEMGSRSSRDGAVAGPSGWSLGTSIRSGDGAVVQPVRLLAPSPVHMPGKRPCLRTKSRNKQHLLKSVDGLCPAQSTLYDMINNTAVKRPLTARDFFMKEKRAIVVEQNPDADYDEVTDILSTMWEDLAEEMRVPFRDKYWHDKQRYNKEVAAAKNLAGKAKQSVGGRGKPQFSVRDMVAAASTQPSPKATVKRKVTHFTSETEVPFAMDLLRNSLDLTSQTSGQVFFPEPKVLACLPSCKAWVCGRGGELCILNANRLSEAIIYQRLVNQHRLPVHHCQPVRLTESNTDGYWSVLEQLAESDSSRETFTQLTDCRITANGFEVKCWKDAEGKLCAELVGVCGDIPTYNVKDLAEVLQLISHSSSAFLAQCRPLKVTNYLKGEAVRMVRQQAGERSVEDIQDLLEEGSSFLPSDCTACIHDRPFFHTLLSDIDSATASQTSVDSLMEMRAESTVCDEGTGRQDIGSAGCGADREINGSKGQISNVSLSLDDLMDFD